MITLLKILHQIANSELIMSTRFSLLSRFGENLISKEDRKHLTSVFNFCLSEANK